MPEISATKSGRAEFIRHSSQGAAARQPWGMVKMGSWWRLPPTCWPCAMKYSISRVTAETARKMPPPTMLVMYGRLAWYLNAAETKQPAAITGQITLHIQLTTLRTAPSTWVACWP